MTHLAGHGPIRQTYGTLYAALQHHAGIMRQFAYAGSSAMMIPVIDLEIDGEAHRVEMVYLYGNQTITTNTSYGTAATDVLTCLVVRGSLTVNAGVTITAANNKRGLVVYASDAITINGAVSMSQLGAAYTPPDGGLTLFGSTVVPKTGGAGGAAVTQSSTGSTVGNAGTSGVATVGCGGGGSGAAARTADTAISGAGGVASGFCGGAGGGGAISGNGDATADAGVAYGGAGGNAAITRINVAWAAAWGGAGNAGGLYGFSAYNWPSDGSHISPATINAPGKPGGLIVVMSEGAIAGNGSLTAIGGAGGGTSTGLTSGAGGGGAGGGCVRLYAKGTISGDLTTSVIGGTGGDVTSAATYRKNGGAGGAGSTHSATLTD